MNQKNILLCLSIYLVTVFPCSSMENIIQITSRTIEFKEACNKKDLNKIATLLSEGQNIDEIIQFNDYKDPITMLSYACYKKSPSLAIFLISYGADIHGKTGPTTSPLALASHLKKEEFNGKLIIPLYRQQKLLTVIQDKIHQQYLLDACAQNDLKTARLYIHLASYKITDQFGRTPLMMACYHKNLVLVHLLLKNGADIHARDKSNWSVIHYASFVNSSTNIDISRPLRGLKAAYTSENLNMIKLLLQNSSIRLNDEEKVLIKYIY